MKNLNESQNQEIKESSGFGFFSKSKSSTLDDTNSLKEPTHHIKSFMKLLVSNSFRDTSEMIVDFIEGVKNGNYNDDIMKLSLHFHEFFNKFKKTLMASNQFRQAVDNDSTIMAVCIERVIFAKLSQIILNVIKKNKNDLKYSFKIYNLCWVNENHLQIPDKIMSNPNLIIQFCSAQSHLREMSVRNSPIGKLRLLTRCCRQLFTLIQAFELNRAASADDFFPLLVYTILKTNPTDVHSNIDFINYFGQRSILESGEYAYYFTSYTCAVQFIDKCEAKSFNVTETEFFENVESSKTEIEKTIQSVNKRMEELKKQRALLWQKTVAFRHSLLHGELMHKSYDIK
uniref:Rab5 GDP/GTP exchange factor (Trinotate prediction) n=1 Tax=Henneguya salminicola TaxID=69463 RepID=A0A6G3MF46_HENSL